MPYSFKGRGSVSPPVTRLRPYLIGERERLGAAVAVGTPFGVVVVLGAISVAFPSGVDVALLGAFSAVPAIAGGICGYGRCGAPAAIVSGITPLFGFHLASGIGIFDPAAIGDAPIWMVSFVVASVGVVWAIAGFAVGVGVGLYRLDGAVSSEQ